MINTLLECEDNTNLNKGMAVGAISSIIKYLYILLEWEQRSC